MPGESQEQAPTAEITAERLIEKAHRAGENLSQIKEKFSKTADALLLYGRTVDQEKPDDPDALTIRDMTLGFMFGFETNSVNTAKGITSETPDYLDLERIDKGFDQLIETTSDPDPQKLLETLEKMAAKASALLRSDWGPESRTDHYLRRQKEIYEAREELLGGISS